MYRALCHAFGMSPAPCRVSSALPPVYAREMRKLPDLAHLAQTDTDIAVRVTPGASRNAITVAEGLISVRVTAPPQDGKANEAVRKLLAKSLGLAKSRLTLVRGATSRDKVFRVN